MTETKKTSHTIAIRTLVEIAENKSGLPSDRTRAAYELLRQPESTDGREK